VPHPSDSPDESSEPVTASPVEPPPSGEGPTEATRDRSTERSPSPEPRASRERPSQPPPPWPESLAPLAAAIEGALAMSARAVGRLSAQANDIRFGGAQRQDETLRAGLRAVQRETGVPGADFADLEARLQVLREQVERFAGQWITPSPSPIVPAATAPTGTPGTAGADTAASADVGAALAAPAAAPRPLGVQQVAGIRQAVTRAMIMLAQAPLHLRIEFGAGFVDPHPDVLLLAARIHAIHRGVRGALKQVCWQSVDRAELSFGNADPARTVEASFDERGRLQVPDAVRQPSGRGPGPTDGAASDRSGGGPRPPRPGQPRSGGGRPSHARPASGPPGSGVPANRPPDGQARGGRPTGPGRPEHAGRPPRSGLPGQGRPAPSGGAARPRDDQRPLKPRSPINPLMADKLRAVLAAAPSPRPATPGADAPASGEPPAPPAPPERGSE
jgi:hypothetical protein